MLRRGVYPYEDIDGWGKSDEISLPDKEDFYGKLNLEDISDEDYVHTQNVWSVFEIRNGSKYHDLYVQSDALLLADVKTLEICVLIYMDLILHILCLYLN